MGHIFQFLRRVDDHLGLPCLPKYTLASWSGMEQALRRREDSTLEDELITEEDNIVREIFDEVEVANETCFRQCTTIDRP